MEPDSLPRTNEPQLDAQKVKRHTHIKPIPPMILQLRSLYWLLFSARNILIKASYTHSWVKILLARQTGDGQ